MGTVVRRRRVLLVVALVLLTASCGAGVFVYRQLNGNIREVPLYSGTTGDAGREVPDVFGRLPINVLLIGSDSRAKAVNCRLGGGCDRFTGQNADVEMVVHVSADRTNITVMSVPRDTVAELRARGVLHKVLVVGEGPARAWFAERVPEALFTGILTGAELGRALASMDVLLNPSVTETFGNVTLEAMASGVPVVGARATGSTSLVADGETGRLVEPGDSAGFADAIAGYVTDPAMRRAHGLAGEARSRAYSWDAINSTVADKYLSLVKARRNELM